MTLNCMMLRWSQLIRQERRAPLDSAAFPTPWARKRSRVAQRFRQSGQATHDEK
jgi:hypothetical protein